MESYVSLSGIALLFFFYAFLCLERAFFTISLDSIMSQEAKWVLFI